MADHPIVVFTKEDDDTIACPQGFFYKRVFEHSGINFYKCSSEHCQAMVSLRENGSLEGRITEDHSHGHEEESALEKEAVEEVFSEKSDEKRESDGSEASFVTIADTNNITTDSGRIVIVASLKKGSEETPKIRKSIQFPLNEPKLLATVINDFFRDYKTWHGSTCFAMIEMKTKNSDEFESVLADYETTLCDDGATYKVVFYDAESVSDVSRTVLTKFALRLASCENVDETSTAAEVVPDELAANRAAVPNSLEEQFETTGECLVTINCDGRPKSKKTSRFNIANPPSLLSLAESICALVFPVIGKQVVATILKFEPNYNDFVNIDAAMSAENGSRYEISFEESDEIIQSNSEKVVVRQAAQMAASNAEQLGQQPGKAMFEAVLKAPSGEEDVSFQKIVPLRFSEQKPIMEVVMTIFYEDTDWSKRDCYAVIQKYDSDFREYVDLSVDYDNVTVADADKFKVKFFHKQTSKHAVFMKRDSSVVEVFVEGVIKSAGDAASDFQQVLTLGENPLKVKEMIEGVYEVHVRPHFPDPQFNVAVLRFDRTFNRQIALNEEYTVVNTRDKESYFIEFVKADLVQQKKRFSILIPETAAPAPVEAAQTQECKAVIEATYKSAEFNSPPFAKSVTFQVDSPVTLMRTITTILYEDTPWGVKQCLASAEFKADGQAEYLTVAADYEETLLEDKTKYRVTFYDAAQFSLEMLPKFCVPLQGTEQKVQESDDEPEVEPNLVMFQGQIHRKIEEPKLKIPLEVACPGQCTDEKRTWTCHNCGGPVFYAFANYLHCNCGAHLRDDASFRCGCPEHGTRFCKLPADAYNNIEKCETINIVLMGETGAGKSTWVDAIFNYLLHASLDEAVDSGILEIPIPTYFLCEDDNKELRRIYVGEQSENENRASGQSATQRPKSYTFMFQGKFYRFIDVPGVGDSRGVDQDRKNFELIMQELYNYDKLHAICILIPSDAPRLTVPMKYCINELLTHLHQDAAKNIVFCFTKSRMNFYKAGNTQEILETYLKNFKKDRNVEIEMNENTMYYFDNESFKFLCALQNGIESLREDKADFEKSWDISARNTNQVLEYIAALEPHMTRKMVSLNEAKRIILELTPISADITKNIQANKRIIQRKKEELQQMKKQTVDLKSQLTIKQITLQAENINHPKTVCASDKCIETMGIPGTKESQVLYKTVCHEHCHLTGIEAGKYPNPGIQGCWAMDASRMSCGQCGCSWEMHLHIRYEQRQVTVDVVNKEVEKVLAGKNTAEVKVSDVIRGLEMQLDTLSLKEKRIKTICAKFVAFLNKNAIAVINDAYGEYLEQSIKVVKNEVNLSGEGSEKVDQLEKYLAEYREEVAIIKEHLENGTEDITVQSITAMKEELKQMEGLGAQFTSFLQASESAQASYTREDEVHLYTSGGGYLKSMWNMAGRAYNYLTNDPTKQTKKEKKQKLKKRYY